MTNIKSQESATGDQDRVLRSGNSELVVTILTLAGLLTRKPLNLVSVFDAL